MAVNVNLESTHSLYTSSFGAPVSGIDRKEEKQQTNYTERAIKSFTSLNFTIEYFIYSPSIRETNKHFRGL